jgi:hypothetical protein
MITDRTDSDVLGEKPVSVPLCPPRNPQGFTWDRTHSCVLRTAWIMALPICRFVELACTCFQNEFSVICKCFKTKCWGKYLVFKKNELSEQFSGLHNKELRDLYRSPGGVRRVKWRRLRWVGHVARMGETKNVFGFYYRCVLCVLVLMLMLIWCTYRSVRDMSLHIKLSSRWLNIKWHFIIMTVAVS